MFTKTTKVHCHLCHHSRKYSTWPYKVLICALSILFISLRRKCSISYKTSRVARTSYRQTVQRI